MPQSVIIKDPQTGQVGQVATTCRVSGSGALQVQTGSASSGPLEEGRSFVASDFAASVAASGGVKEYLIRAPAKGAVQLGARYAVGGDMQLEFIEGPTSDTDGSAVTVFNRNRQSSLTANALVFEDPTNVAGGLTIANFLVPGGNDRKGSTTGTGGEQADLILAQSTDYVLRFTNNSAQIEPLAVTINWVEDGTDP